MRGQPADPNTKGDIDIINLVKHLFKSLRSYNKSLLHLFFPVEMDTKTIQYFIFEDETFIRGWAMNKQLRNGQEMDILWYYNIDSLTKPLGIGLSVSKHKMWMQADIITQ